MAVKFKIDAASAISKGGREYQEDALIMDFARGANVGIAVLSDGMGGHAAGDLASQIVVTEVFSELIFRRADLEKHDGVMTKALRRAAESANDSLASYVADHPQAKGMGATLISCVIVGSGLSWISIGDSPLYIFRDNVLSQLNEDHSLGPHIDFLVSSGALSAVEGQNHPERNALTSVLFGKDIQQVDCPEHSFPLILGDTLIVASDGLQFLSNEAIAQTLRDFPISNSASLAENLMLRLDNLKDPDLDNVTLMVMRVLPDEPATLPRKSEPALRQASSLPKWPFGRHAAAKEHAILDKHTAEGG